MTKNRILVGTASWSDPGFVKAWYPAGMAASERLVWYAGQFEMVEVNSTFYAAPNRRMVEQWCRTTPEHFVFDIKLHQLLSRHAPAPKLLPPKIRRLAAVGEKGKVVLTPEIEAAMIDQFLPSLHLLRAAGKLGALLLQLSPEFSPRRHSLDELENLFSALAEFPIALELRNRGWIETQALPATLAFLRAHRVTLVSVDTPADEHFTVMPRGLDEITHAPLAYLRLHGRNARGYLRGKSVAARFDYDYSDAEISEIAGRARKLAEQAKAVHVVFNNNNLDYAPRAALRLRAALGQVFSTPPRQPDLFADRQSA